MSIFNELFSDNPNDAAYLALASGLLSGKGNFSSILGNSLAGAQGVYSQAKEAGQKNQLTKMQIEEMARRMKQQEQATTDQESFRQSLLSQPSPQMLASQQALAGGGGPTMANAAKMPEVDPLQTILRKALETRQIDPMSYAKTLQKDNSPIKLGVGEKLLKPGTYQELASNPKDAADDKDVALLKMIYGEGTPEYMAAMRQLATKRTTHQPAASMNNYGTPLPVNLPGGGTGYLAPPTRPGAPSALLTIPGTNTPAQKPGEEGKPASESERTAGFLLQRIRDSRRQLESAVSKNPGAASPSAGPEAARLIAEPLANVITGPERQKVEAAQLDILDAALTLGTGAAYTREQLLGYRKSFFPQLGDSKEAITDKAERLKNLIRAAETKAGKAAADKGASGGWSIERE